MAHSFVIQERAIADGMAQGHRYWFGYPVLATLRHEADRLPTAALISSANDLARFLLAQRFVDSSGTAASPRLLSRKSLPGNANRWHRGGRLRVRFRVASEYHREHPRCAPRGIG